MSVTGAADGFRPFHATEVARPMADDGCTRQPAEADEQEQMNQQLHGESGVA